MREASRIPAICERLARAWEQCPDLRLGQLMYGVSSYVLTELNRDDFYMEDEEFMQCIEQFCARHEQPIIYNGGNHD